MDKTYVYVKDRVQTVKGTGVVVQANGKSVLVDLDGDHGIYFFHRDSVWKLVDNNQEEIIANDGRSIYAVDICDLEELVYDTNTQIVYIRQNNHNGFSIYTLYLSENGFPYRYVNGELVEVGK